MAENLSQFWAWITSYIGAAGGVLSIAAGIIVIITLLEKVADKEFIGRRIFRLIGQIAKFLFNWLTWPIKPKMLAVKAVLDHGDRLDKSFKQLMETGQEREERRTLQFEELRTEIQEVKISAKKVESEVTFNGGKSLKDAIVRLERHDNEKWNVIERVLQFVEVTSLRLDIADEARKCMTFRLSPTGACTEISAMFLRSFGYTEKDILGSDWEFCIAKQSLPEVQERWRKAFAQRQRYRCDQFIIDSDGKEHYCRVQGYPLPLDRDGEFQGFYGTVEVLDADPIKH